MNVEQLRKFDFPIDMTRRLFTEFTDDQYFEKIELVEKYVDSVKNQYDVDVLHIRLENIKGFIYWMAGLQSESNFHFEKVLKVLKTEHNPLLFFHIVILIIRNYKDLKDYNSSYKWVEIGFNQIDFIDSSFTKLYLLKEYKDLLVDAGWEFNPLYEKYIVPIISELGFRNIINGNPVTMIEQMSNSNKVWNKLMSQIHLSHGDDLQKREEALLDYINKCEIDWYVNYAKEKLSKIRNKKA